MPGGAYCLAPTDPDRLEVGGRVKHRSAPAQGVALALYAFALPLVAFWQWERSASTAHPYWVRAIVIALSILWLIFLWQLRSAVKTIRAGLIVPGSGYQWLATTLLALLPLLGSQLHRHSPAPHGAISWQDQSKPGTLAGTSWLASAPLALAAKRVADGLRDQPSVNPDLMITQLRQRDPLIEAHILANLGKGAQGVVTLNSPPSESLKSPKDTTPTAASIASLTSTSLTIAFVRPGGVLDIPADWSLAKLESALVALHDGRLVLTGSEHQLLRALALSSRSKTLVLHLTTRDQIDPELANLCATLSRPLTTSRGELQPMPRVRLLQASPDIENLAQPLDPSLRRRLIEMASYLTLHQNEPVTGERLRSRVLAHAGVDASPRVLANVASALRRSLGADALGTRLHSVSAAGLYQSHGLTSDVQEFHNLMAVSRSCVGEEQQHHLREALELVRSEPLASSLRGFEWFIAEGHQAKLSRDGEWAALALADSALRTNDVELAFWAIRQGLLLDPYSDDLAEALTAIPRLREFRSNGTSASQHQSVGASGAIAVRWALTSLTQQVRQ